MLRNIDAETDKVIYPISRITSLQLVEQAIKFKVKYLKFPKQSRVAGLSNIR